MAAPRIDFSDGQLLDALEKNRKKDGSWHIGNAAKSIGIHRCTLSAEISRRELHQYQTGDPPEEGLRNLDGGAVEVVAAGCRSVEELYGRFELDEDRWRVKDGSLETRVYVSALGDGRLAEVHYMKARFQERAADDPRTVLRLALDQIAKKSPVKGRRRPKTGRQKEPVLALVGLTDLHLGKPGWVSTAEDAWRSAIGASLTSMGGHEVAEIILPIGSDMGHFDTPDQHTSAMYGGGGTPLDSAGIGLVELRDRCQRLLVETVERLLEVAPVRLVCAPGNHDWHLSLSLADYLAAWYRHDKGVTRHPVNDEGRSYVTHGGTLLCIYHGKIPKPTQLASIVAAEEARLWGASVYREIIHGHVHHEKLHEELAGVMVRGLGCLSPSDRWHKLHGYVGSRRQSQTILYGTDGVRQVSYHAAKDPRAAA